MSTAISSLPSSGKKGALQRFLDIVERGGNALPHPIIMFFYFAAGTIVLSAILNWLGVSVSYDAMDRHTGELTATTVSIQSLLTADGIRFMFTNAIRAFTGHAALGTILVAMLGVGVAEHSGLIGAMLKRMVLATPKSLLTPILVFAGIMSNIASDAGYVVLVPLGAIVFMSFGRHPLAGIAAAFAGVSGGFSANLVIGSTDPLLGGISTEAARIMDPAYMVTPVANYYFMFVSTFLITIMGTFVTDKIVEPRLGSYGGEMGEKAQGMTPEEMAGLKRAKWAFFALIALLCALIIPEAAPLRDPATGEILGNSPFMQSIILILTAMFLIPGAAYGFASGTFENKEGVVTGMVKSMSSMASVLVIIFVSAQFVSYFTYSNLGIVAAVSGADLLHGIGFTGIPLAVAMVVLSAIVNLFMGGASSKWLIMAPVFIPMFMQLGFTPEYTQVAYRIGDSTTNIITPLMTYFPIIASFAARYQEENGPKIGMGTVISMMMPYTFFFLGGWIVLFVVWSLLNLPLGPGAVMFM